jgi:aspartate ammonia-lyase
MRRENDSLGEVSIPPDRLYGSNTARALENFPIQDRVLGEETGLVRAMAEIKQACARANKRLGALEASIADALIKASEEMIAGELDAHLVVPLLEGSGGTSTNMNVNEVLANRAQVLLGHAPGSYDIIHPNDHVNCGQSTNDVLPSAIKLAAYRLAGAAVESILGAATSMHRKANEFDSVYRLGRTCLQDGQPMTLGQAFEGYAAVTDRAARGIERQRSNLLGLPLGGTAIGTGLGATPGFRDAVFRELCDVTSLDLSPAKNRFDGMQNLDELQRLSAELETTSGALAKIAKDLILLSSGPAGGLGEINLPAVQPGSSIMPGKVNPVIPMAVVQLSQLVHGNHACIAMACQDGMLEINHYEHSLASRLFDSLHRTREIGAVFASRCIDGIEANAERSLENLHNSFALATSLVPRLGYAEVSRLVKQSLRDERAFLELAVERGLIEREEITALIESVVRPE